MNRLRARRDQPGRGVVSACLLAAIGGCEQPVPRSSVWVTIPEEATLETVADSLAAYGIIRAPGAFQRYARIGRRHESIRAGTYELKPGTPMPRILSTLQEGRPPMRRVAVRPGMRLSEVALLFERLLGVPAPSFEAAARDSLLAARVAAEGGSVEGYLYPDAYYIRLNATPDQVVASLVQRFEESWRPAWEDRRAELGLSRHEVVTLASIIEGEAARDEDRRFVSSVYHNRLARGMRLQADPTVAYALGVWRRLYHRDYEIDSPYNTYRINGLPPGPIGQPSGASLRAALFPAETDFYYFVAGPDGRHVFSNSYPEHLHTIRQVR